MKSHPVEGERWDEVLEAAQGRSADRRGKLHQRAPLLAVHILYHLSHPQALS